MPCQYQLVPPRGLLSCPATVLLLLLLITDCIASAQTLPTRRYTTRDGLVADRVTVITQDNDGYMWMGSLFGISRYDGNQFTTIRLPASQQYKYVTSLLAADNKVYAGFLFSGGLMQYTKGKIKTFLPPPVKSVVSHDVIGLFDDEAGIFVVNSNHQVYHFNHEQFKHVFTLDTTYSQAGISGMVRDEAQRIWIGTGFGLMIFENGKLRSLPGAKGPVLHLRKTNAGITVVRTENNQTLFELWDADGNSKTIARTGYLRQIPFMGTQQNSFWGIEGKQGLFKMSPTGKMQFYASSSYTYNEIKYLFADRENNLWMATDPGVLKIANVPAVSYEFEELAPGGADIGLGKDVTWCTNSKYLYAIKDGKLQKMPDFRDDRNRGYLGSLITDDQNNLWVTSWDRGIWRLNYKNNQLLRKELFMYHGQEKIDLSCFVQDKQGNIWGGGKGLYRIRDGAVRDYFPITEKNGDPLFITSITLHPQKQEIWLGKNAGGLLKVSYNLEGDKYSCSVTERLDESNGLTDGSIRSLAMDTKENLWIGTRLRGIFRMRSNAQGKYVFQHYGADNGISCSRVTDIVEEEGKAVWFATCDGIFKFSFEGERWQHFGAGDGLLSAEIFALALDAGNNHILGVSGQGITDIYYASDTNAAPPPLINITQVSILGKEDSAALLLDHPKKLSSDENSIGFTFAGTSYIDEKKIRYKYMLEGYEKEWSLLVETNNVNYASLPFGHYTFKVLASNGQRWSEHPATFSFQIVRPFYKSFWFLALLVCLLALSFYFIRVYRLKQRLKLEKLRVNIARDLHDDIGSALGSINLLSENATRRLATNASATEVAGVFQKIGHSAQSMLDSMDDIIWTINPEKDSLEDLLIRMREFAIPLLEAKNIAFDINMHAAEGIRPSLEIKRNIYLVFKEAIFNIVRHSGSTNVCIKASFTARNFDLIITDNGKGFDESIPSSRNGVKNMRKRAGISGASLSIDTAPGAGTTIHFHGNIR
ncbi:MAG TPA: two-component regulator propeller domain-containing protein [Chitinophagaceae bacterium]|nr:two-component regulator propeller domain-containing protein [Chitinophagaceae bacterium]